MPRVLPRPTGGSFRKGKSQVESAHQPYEPLENESISPLQTVESIINEDNDEEKIERIHFNEGKNQDMEINQHYVSGYDDLGAEESVFDELRMVARTLFVICGGISLYILQALHSFFGIELLKNLSRDGKLLFVAKSSRMFAFGFLAVMLVVYLVEVGFTPDEVGLLFSFTLCGDAAISLYLTSCADRYGRRKTLIIGAILGFFTSIMFLFSSNFWILLLAATVGVISPSGNEIGPFMAIELSSLSQVCRESERTHLMALYNLISCFSSAAGALFCGLLLSLAQGTLRISPLSSYRIVMFMYALLKLLLIWIFMNLSVDIEVPSTSDNPATVNPNINPIKTFLGLHKSQKIVLQLSALFAMDAFAGSFILQSLISNWFHTTYDTKPAILGTIVFVCNIVAGVSALFAVKIANAIGLIMTMAVTHLPSNILTIMVPLMPNESSAIVIICLRYSISQMDVPTRNAYVQGVVDPNERSGANGVCNVARSIGASSGPFLAGLLYAHPKTAGVPFIIAGCLKVIYDLLLLYSFNAVKPSSELEGRPSRESDGGSSERPAASKFEIICEDDEEDVYGQEGKQSDDDGNDIQCEVNKELQI